MLPGSTHLHRLVDAALVGSRWRTFCGCSRETLLASLTAVLEDGDVAFEVDERVPSSTERFLYGTDADATRVTITDPFETDIVVVPVTADPIARVALSVTTRADVRERATAGVCLVDVSPIPDDESDLARLMTDASRRLECEPWDLGDHPRFRFALLQRYKIRAKWRYWFRRTPVSETGQPAPGDGSLS